MQPLHIQLQQARFEKQISAEEMAKLLNVSLQQYMEVESGTTREDDTIHQLISSRLFAHKMLNQKMASNPLSQLASELHELGLKIEQLNRKINSDNLL